MLPGCQSHIPSTHAPEVFKYGRQHLASHIKTFTALVAGRSTVCRILEMMTGCHSPRLFSRRTPGSARTYKSCDGRDPSSRSPRRVALENERSDIKSKIIWDAFFVESSFALEHSRAWSSKWSGTRIRTCIALHKYQHESFAARCLARFRRTDGMERSCWVGLDIDSL